MDGSHATMQRCIKTMDDFAYAVVRERRDDPQSSEYNDLLSRFMNVQADAETGRGYSDKELRDIVMNMVMYVVFIWRALFVSMLALLLFARPDCNTHTSQCRP